ncbi:hypothetical protein RhiJN_03629 [Ceratobasidium sp. AG-Ba]|nr:hypothetical protein RhiJN_03629 [Ceratobasidium sp. AG-Ba]QRW04520.1 hypothetical protein RhiLY_03519 [Ceratobasidium sp. AG-Ba]
MSRSYYSPDGQANAADQYQQFAEPATQATPTHGSGPSGDGYGLVYPDGGFSGADGSTFEDRLRSLMRQQADDLRAFAEREGRNIRAQASALANASPHEFLYSAAMQPLTPQDTITKMDAALEHLHQALGYDGFLAIVTPVDADGDGGITAGTKIGLEFWKGLRGGGLAGLKSLKLRCKASREATMEMGGGGARVMSTSSGGMSASRKSLDIKQELNSAMRNALREAAGDPLAEMRWTKPEQLEGYGVRIIGWPPEIALRNPSNNPVRDNKTLLSLLKSGQLRFVKKDSPEWDQADPSALVRSTAQAQAPQPSQPAPTPGPQLVQPPVQQTPVMVRTPSFASTPPAAVPTAHPQIAYVYQVPGGQGWIPLSGVSVYSAPFTPAQMVVNGPTGPTPGQEPDGSGTVNVAQISNDAGKKRRSEGSVSGTGGKKRRGTGASG